MKKWLLLGVALALFIGLPPIQAEPQTTSLKLNGPTQSVNSSADLPKENFVILNPTLPNEDLNFNDDSNQSCCQKDYPPKRQSTGTSPVVPQTDPYPEAKADPRYVFDCQGFEALPELVSNDAEFPDLHSVVPTSHRTIFSNSTNVSKRQFAGFFVNVGDSGKRYPTDSFHIGTQGGMSMVSMRDVSSYSVCMARGGNVVAIADTDNASVITYNGADHIYYAGNNTNMLTRTGAGPDLIEIHQAEAKAADLATPAFRNERWQSYNIYRTALSGGAGEDTVIIKDSPSGTKWCYLGGYHMFGEYFYVVEFALPPSVTEGPRRQRMNIGKSVEYVVFQGRKYALSNFLHHGSPADELARSRPLGDAPAQQ